MYDNELNLFLPAGLSLARKKVVTFSLNYLDTCSMILYTKQSQLKDKKKINIDVQ